MKQDKKAMMIVIIQGIDIRESRLHIDRDTDIYYCMIFNMWILYIGCNNLVSACVGHNEKKRNLYIHSEGVKMYVVSKWVVIGVVSWADRNGCITSSNHNYN